MLDVCSKIDLHIHSVASNKKDKKLVEDGTKENIKVLIDKLVENNINIASITDHNIFDYTMYSELKKTEGENNCIAKILPGIELDVTIAKKNVHVVCIFDDTNDGKVRNIANVFDGSKDTYTLGEISDLLKSVSINAVLIAHQKSSPVSKNQKQNLSKIGTQKFNEFLNMGYLDAVEFSNEKVQSILKKYKYDYNLNNMVAITGSDCHVWTKYPKTRDSDEAPLSTYIRSLPTFKGLVMAITEPNRISTQPFSFDKSKFYEEFEIKIDGEIKKVKLSKGMNVIIGDNSLGKSMIVNRLMGKKQDPKTEKGYKSYLEKNKMQIISSWNDVDVKYIEQGGIRAKFEKDGVLLANEFKHKFLPLSTTTKLLEVERYLNSILTVIKYNSQNDEQIAKLCTCNLKVPYKQNKVPIILSTKNNLSEIKEKDEKEITEKIASIVDQIKDLLNLKGLENSDKNLLKETIEELETMKNKYLTILDTIVFQKKIYNALQTAEKQYVDKVMERSGDISNEYINYDFVKREAVNILKEYIKLNNKKKPNIKKFNNLVVKNQEDPFNKYKFVTSPQINLVEKSYLDDIILEMFDGRTIKDINEILCMTQKEVEENFVATIKNQPLDMENKFKDYVLNKIKGIFSETYKIIYSDQEIEDGNSSGTNALIYLDLNTIDTDKRVLIIDQPEDYIAQKKIAKDLISVLRRIAIDRQILIITHNPQLVVNLDVDNVIIFKKSEKKLDIINGALEYENERDKIDILKEVADILDGGEETIRRRWKRYEKTND